MVDINKVEERVSHLLEERVSHLSSQKVMAYLVAQKWRVVRNVGGSTLLDSPGGALRLWVPIEGGLEEDFAVSMIKVLSKVAFYENKTLLELMKELEHE